MPKSQTKVKVNKVNKNWANYNTRFILVLISFSKMNAQIICCVWLANVSNRIANTAKKKRRRKTFRKKWRFGTCVFTLVFYCILHCCCICLCVNKMFIGPTHHLQAKANDTEKNWKHQNYQKKTNTYFWTEQQNLHFFLLCSIIFDRHLISIHLLPHHFCLNRSLARTFLSLMVPTKLLNN